MLEDLDLLVDAIGDLLEGQLHLDAKVGPFHPTATAAATSTSPKGATEDVAKLREDVVHVHATPAKSTGTAAHAFVAKPVVLLALGVVAQDFIRLRRLLELLLAEASSGFLSG